MGEPEPPALEASQAASHVLRPTPTVGLTESAVEEPEAAGTEVLRLSESPKEASSATRGPSVLDSFIPGPTVRASVTLSSSWSGPHPSG